MSSSHETWVTRVVRQWFAEEHPDVIPGMIREIREMNREAGNDPEDSSGDDVEYLADKAEEFAKQALTPYAGHSLVREFLLDCLSEAEWTELATDWLTPAFNKGELR